MIKQENYNNMLTYKIYVINRYIGMNINTPLKKLIIVISNSKNSMLTANFQYMKITPYSFLYIIELQ